jgi:hypothetical protein
MVSIDIPAGPSEVLVIADKYANPVYVAVDLLSQVLIFVRVYLVGYIFCIIDYHIRRDIFGRLYILYNRLPYMSGYI